MALISIFRISLILALANLYACGGQSEGSQANQQPDATDTPATPDQPDQPDSPEPQPDTPTNGETTEPDSDSTQCTLPDLPEPANKQLLGQADDSNSYTLDAFFQRQDLDQDLTGTWLAIHQVEQHTDLGLRGREVVQIWQSNVFQIRNQQGQYQIASCDLSGGWHDFSEHESTVQLPLFASAGYHPSFTIEGPTMISGQIMNKISADEGHQGRPVSFHRQHTQAIKVAALTDDLGHVDHQINQLSLNQPIQCFTRRLERKFEQGCEQNAKLMYDSTTLVATGEQGSSALAVSAQQDKYLLISSLQRGNEQRDGLTASQPELVGEQVEPVQTAISTQFTGTNTNQGQSTVSFTLNIDAVP